MSKSFFTVGIGASAGGQRALAEFFDGLSPQIDAAFVIVTHLIRDRRSVLDEIIARHTWLPVIRVEDDLPVFPKYIYVLPENATMVVQDGWLKLSVRGDEVKNSAVDIFFESLANDFKEKAVAIVLSGGGRDGLQGALRINEMGGKVMAQDPLTAQFNGMPQSIVDYDHPSAVLSPAHLAAEINSWCVIKNDC